MNFYKHHLGDYAAATSHLSWDEDCAYRRLLDAYYKREAPIPADVKDACRLVRASTPAQRRSVEAVLGEFFTVQADGWHQKRSDEEIGKASAQAETNRQIAEKREADKRARIEHESLQRAEHGSLHESLHGSSTPPTGEREPSQTPDSRLQTPEKEKPPSGVQGASKPKGLKRCPDSFVVTAELVAWAKEQAPGVDVPRETVKLRNHEFAKPRSDWPATWRNWILEAADRLRPGNGGAKSFRERDEQLAAEKYRRWTSSGTAPPAGDVIDMEDPDAARIGNG